MVIHLGLITPALVMAYVEFLVLTVEFIFWFLVVPWPTLNLSAVLGDSRLVPFLAVFGI